ncbi:hypothetical protein ACQFYA_02410 [Promicromonospora sp. Marseille-Q5078]
MTASRGPLPRATALAAVARCVVVSAALLARRRIRLAGGNVGRVIRFDDGTSARVYRETVALRQAQEPCVLVVTFRLRGVRGRRGHTLFRRESLLNTPLFVGFPGFVSKLWLADDDLGRYRGLYEWDGAQRAERYARSLWRVLELVSEKGSIDYRVVPGARRDQVLVQPRLLAGSGPAAERWWRVGQARPTP